MPYKDPQATRDSNNRSYQKNKEKWKPTRKRYRDDNKKKMSSYYAQYQKDNREKINKRNRDRRKLDPEFRKKANEKGKLWRQQNPEKIALMKKKSILKHKYGLTLEEYQDLLKSQENKCAICKREKLLCVDHNHETGNVRGLLCHLCNRAIGMLMENINILENAIKYIENNTQTISKKSLK